MTDTELTQGHSLVTIAPQTLMEDTHEQLARLRREHSVISLGENQYMALKANDVMDILSDSWTRQMDGENYARYNQLPEGYAARFLRDFFLFQDGEGHRAGRSLFMRAFAPRAIQALDRRIGLIADLIVADLPRGEDFNFLKKMAARIPAETMASILGLPDCDAMYFGERVHSLARIITPVYPHEHHDDIEEAARELFDYLEEQVLERLESPGDDFLSAVVSDWKELGTFPLETLINHIVGLVIGGTDTTRTTFAMLVGLLLQHPGQWQALKSDRSLVPGAVSEAMRYDPVAGSIARIATLPKTLAGVLIPAGAVIRANVMSAMRDPGLYDNPDLFDITRTDHPRQHLVFGLGAHRCICETLARMEMEAGLTALIDAAPGIELVTAPRLIGFGGIRQITEMTVRIP